MYEPMQYILVPVNPEAYDETIPPADDDEQ